MIQCFRPRFVGKEFENLRRCLESGTLASGPMVREFEDKWRAISKKNSNVGFNSASSASLAIFAFLKEKYGSCDVYAPSLSFSSPVWAAKQCGHNVIFVDVSTTNFSTSRQLIEDAMAKHSTPGRRKVVFPLLYGGISSIIVQEPSDDVSILVDSCHTVNPDVSCDYMFFSFHPVKPVAMGNGGILSTDNEEAAEYFRRFRDFGRKPTAVSYDVAQSGFNFYMNDLNAAIGLAQLEYFQENIETRKTITQFYNEQIDRQKYEIVTHVDSKGRSSYYLYTVITKSSDPVDGLIQYMKSKGVEVIIHYPLIHKLTYFQNSSPTRLENCEGVEHRFINIPCHASMSLEDARLVAEALNSYANN